MRVVISSSILYFVFGNRNCEFCSSYHDLLCCVLLEGMQLHCCGISLLSNSLNPHTVCVCMLIKGIDCIAISPRVFYQLRNNK